MGYIKKKRSKFFEAIAYTWRGIRKESKSTLAWAVLIIVGWVVNFLIQKFFIYDEHFFYVFSNATSSFQHSVSHFVSAFALASTLIIIFIGSIRIYTSLFQNHQDRTRELLEGKFSSGIIKCYEGLKAIESLEKSMLRAKTISNTRFVHHPDKDSDLYQKDYNNAYKLWRVGLEDNLREKEVTVYEISNEKLDTKRLNQLGQVSPGKVGIKGSYIGKYSFLSNESWINFTILDFEEEEDFKRPSELWFGHGVDLSGNPHLCFFTKNKQLVDDFKKRFKDLYKKLNKPY